MVSTVRIYELSIDRERAQLTRTNCAIRQLMDINTKQYDERIMKAVKADIKKLPQILPTGECLG